VVSAFGGSLLVHRHKNGTGRRRWGGAVIVTERPDVLPEAATEGAGVADSFVRSARLHGPAATRSALVARLRTTRVAHFACHAYFDAAHPLAGSIGLPSGETWRAPEWLGGIADGLPLVSLSACRSAAVAPLAGGEVFGLVSGILGGGGGAVLAGLWPVADRETKTLMWRFYRERLTNDLAGALALAQRAALRGPDASPLFWAAFALFGDADALPRPGRLWAWLARWRQRRHARRFPTPDLPSEGDGP
jgi:CHAT domain-containing protein